jgi:hypothetical protein
MEVLLVVNQGLLSAKRCVLEVCVYVARDSWFWSSKCGALCSCVKCCVSLAIGAVMTTHLNMAVFVDDASSKHTTTACCTSITARFLCSNRLPLQSPTYTCCCLLCTHCMLKHYNCTLWLQARAADKEASFFGKLRHMVLKMAPNDTRASIGMCTHAQ